MFPWPRKAEKYTLMKTQGLTKLLSLEEWLALGNWLDGMWVMDCGGGGGGATAADGVM